MCFFWFKILWKFGSNQHQPKVKETQKSQALQFAELSAPWGCGFVCLGSNPTPGPRMLARGINEGLGMTDPKHVSDCY